MTKMRKRLGDEGFTLIELMVVVLIIAVLVAIAIPSFLGFRSRAQDRSAQSDVRNTLLAEKAYWVDNGDYSTTASDLKAYEPTISLHATDPAEAVVAATASNSSTGEDIVCLSRTSDSGTIYSVWDGENTGTYYGTGSLAGSACTSSTPSGHSQGGW
ncbi:MAG: type II secretion system protein [Acidimicrobiia bacterium]